MENMVVSPGCPLWLVSQKTSDMIALWVCCEATCSCTAAWRGRQGGLHCLLMEPAQLVQQTSVFLSVLMLIASWSKFFKLLLIFCCCWNSKIVIKWPFWNDVWPLLDTRAALTVARVSLRVSVSFCSLSFYFHCNKGAGVGGESSLLMVSALPSLLIWQSVGGFATRSCREPCYLAGLFFQPNF